LVGKAASVAWIVSVNHVCSARTNVSASGEIPTWAQ
jgi:hypothetical protein